MFWVGGWWLFVARQGVKVQSWQFRFQHVMLAHHKNTACITFNFKHKLTFSNAQIADIFVGNYEFDKSYSGNHLVRRLVHGCTYLSLFGKMCIFCNAIYLPKVTKALLQSAKSIIILYRWVIYMGSYASPMKIYSSLFTWVQRALCRGIRPNKSASRLFKKSTFGFWVLRGQLGICAI